MSLWHELRLALHFQSFGAAIPLLYRLFYSARILWDSPENQQLWGCSCPYQEKCLKPTQKAKCFLTCDQWHPDFWWCCLLSDLVALPGFSISDLCPVSSHWKPACTTPILNIQLKPLDLYFVPNCWIGPGMRTFPHTALPLLFLDEQSHSQFLGLYATPPLACPALAASIGSTVRSPREVTHTVHQGHGCVPSDSSNIIMNLSNQHGPHKLLSPWPYCVPSPLPPTSSLISSGQKTLCCFSAPIWTGSGHM